MLGVAWLYRSTVPPHCVPAKIAICPETKPPISVGAAEVGAQNP